MCAAVKNVMQMRALRLMPILTKEYMRVKLISRKHLSYREGQAVLTDKDLANGPCHINYGTAPKQT